MTPEQAAALRAAFKPEQIGVLPKPYSKDSPKGFCNVCHGKHGLPAAHLDYVGHAAATDRLLQVDPGWTWEPFAVDQQGLPALDREGNLWIRLTICGVTRPGVGDGPSAKVKIGDAIRNAAMRFGVALDLWAKEDLTMSNPPADVDPGPQPDQSTGEVQMTPAERVSAARSALFLLAAEKLPGKTQDQIMLKVSETAAAANPPVDMGNLNDVHRLIELWKA